MYRRATALSLLRVITAGIDDCHSETAWWETSTGATFGEGRLRELRKLVVELTED